MVDLDRIGALAKSLLTVQDTDGSPDPFIWQHSERVARLAGSIACLPEFADRALDRVALHVAGLFHDAGWVVQFREGRCARWQILGKPTSDIQRELGAALMVEQIAHLVPGATLDTAAEAIRNCNYRDTALVTAQVLSEAENLDDVGITYLMKQIRVYHAEGRGIDQLLRGWQRQQEYQYWDARVKDCFRLDTIRQLARVRLAAVDRFMTALSSEQDGDDVQRLVESLGMAVTSA